MVLEIPLPVIFFAHVYAGSHSHLGASPPLIVIYIHSYCLMSYYLYKQNHARLAGIGVHHYSFSVSWTRIVPFGVAGSPINVKGLEHYDDVINSCLANGLVTIATLDHFDSPAGISLDDGSTFVDASVYYAKQVMTRYANRVFIWLIFNEPNVMPLIFCKSFNCLTNILTAHSTIYYSYKHILKGKGRLTMKPGYNIAIPLTDSTNDMRAAQRYQDF